MTPDAATPSAPARPFVGAARVLAGAGTSARIGEELLATGVLPQSGAVLVVVDAAVLELGLAEAALSAGFEVRVGPGVAREPSPETIEALTAVAAGEPVAAVLGIGGGSAIDAAKLACASLTNSIELTAGLAPTVALAATPKLLAVPTTAGTGAEVTSVAMLWHEDRKRIFVHDRLVPSHATLDLDVSLAAQRGALALGAAPPFARAVGGVRRRPGSARRDAARRARSRPRPQRLGRRRTLDRLRDRQSGRPLTRRLVRDGAALLPRILPTLERAPAGRDGAVGGTRAGAECDARLDRRAERRSRDPRLARRGRDPPRRDPGDGA
jgi:hypothetical protein